MTGFDAERWQAEAIVRVEAALEARFHDVWPDRFGLALRYPLFTGGKRFRPLLVMAACEAVGGDPSAALPAAVAVELVHTYSLVHDDLPCMDDDDERRGMPTVHRAFDEATAVLVGDALLTEAFVALSEVSLPAIRLLAVASGAAGMVGGQAGDIARVTSLEALERVHALKTGALIAAATEIGGLVGGADPGQRALLQAFGRDVGLGFQLADDVLDADEALDPDGPPSFVRFLGVSETRARAIALGEQAIAGIAAMPRPGALQALARLAVARAR